MPPLAPFSPCGGVERKAKARPLWPRGQASHEPSIPVSSKNEGAQRAKAAPNQEREVPLRVLAAVAQGEARSGAPCDVR